MRAQPPNLLQIHREALQAGAEAAYDAIEADTARLCAALGCPHPYLALTALTGSPEVWFLNGFASQAEQQHVIEAYAKNAPLMTALKRNSEAKSALTAKPVGIFASHRPDLSRGVPWEPGTSRFLVITATTSTRQVDGTVFETAEAIRLIVVPADTRRETDAIAALAAAQSHILAVRPAWSFPAKEWIAADPAFWPSRPL
jgi:hypothetical protein